MSEAIIIDLNDGRKTHNLKDYGLTDWHHDKDGKINYPWYKSTRSTNHVNLSAIESREEQRWAEDYNEEALDNLDYGRNLRAARCEFFKEWERNERLYN